MGPPKSVAQGRPLAFVLGDINLLRPLGLAGIACAVAGNADSPAVYSRFAQMAVHWGGSVSEPSDGLVDVLIRFGSEQSQPPVLFYQWDSPLLLISRHRKRLAEVYQFVIPDPSLVELLFDKEGFQGLAEREDLPVPRAHVIDPAEGQVSLDFDLRYPVIVKPVTRLSPWEAHFGPQKALQFETAADLRDMMPQLLAVGLRLMIQESIVGPETRVESYHVYATGGGEVVADFTGRKVRTRPSYCGYSTALTITDAGDVAELGRHLVRKLKLAGVAKFDFKRGPDGRLHLLEINPRFNLWHHLGAAAGLNLPALVYADLVGLPRPTIRPAQAGTCWSQPLTDWRAAKEVGVPLASRLKWLLQCEAKTTNWDDPMPFVISRLRRSTVFRGLCDYLSRGKFTVVSHPYISVGS
jgi:D-aspartate ligase